MAYVPESDGILILYHNGRTWAMPIQLLTIVVHSGDGNPMLVADRYEGAIARNGLKTVTIPKETRDSASIVERVLQKYLHKGVNVSNKLD